MTDIAKSILGGGWSLVAGWILPTAINVLVFGFFVLPSLDSIKIASELSRASVGERSFAVLGASVVIGLTLNAVQVPLYRFLEGYLLWPRWLAKLSRGHQLRRKKLLNDRLELIRLGTLEADHRLVKLEDKKRLETLSADPKMKRLARADQERTAIQRSLLEQLRRYPSDDAQVAPTRLGNAIRRLEEYGYQRYQLDSQTLWYNLMAVAPRQARRQVDLAQTGVDFFVCLLYGNLLVAAIAFASLGAQHPSYLSLFLTAAV